MKRRTLFHTAFTGVALAQVAGAVDARAASGADAVGLEIGIIDANVSLFHWPYRRLPYDEVADLVEKLRSLQIAQAWAGSFEGVLHRDMDGVNARLATACREHGGGLLRPVGAIHPMLPNWKEDLRRCVEVHQMAAIRLHPNYHGYTLEDPMFERLLEEAASAGLLVQLAVTLEDTRTQHPLAQVAEVDLKPLAAVLRRQAQARLMLLNHRPSAAITAALGELPNLFFDIARTEATDGVTRLLALVPPERVVFGSHAPFLIPEAALIRLEEAGLDAAQAELLLRQNALRLVP